MMAKHFFLISGPISSAFVNKYGCRPVTIAGAILAASCLFASVYATNVTTLYFTVGIGTGFGFGLIYLPAIVSVTTYFEKYRSLATGIAVCGSGLGTFIFSPFIQYLIAEYGWRGSMMIISAICLNCIFFGAMFRPLEWENTPPPKESMVKYTVENETVKTTTEKTEANGSADVLDDDEHMLAKSDNNMQRPHSIGQFSLIRSLRLEKNGNVAPPFISEKLKNGQGQANRMALSTPLLITSTASEPFRQFGSQVFKKSGILNRKDVFYQGSLMNLPQYKSRSDLKYEGNEIDRPHSSRSIRRRAVSINEEQKDYCSCLSEDTKDTLAEMMDVSLFRDPIFILFTLSNFCTSIGFNVPYVFLVPRAKALGLSGEDASYLLAVIGIANTVGRIILGYLSDKAWVNRLWVYNVCLTICGVGKLNIYI